MQMGEPWRSMFSSESRYLNRLHVFGIGDRFGSNNITDLELGMGVDPNNQQKIIHVSEPGATRIDPVHQNLQDKITAVLKLLAFREQQVIVQFWSPRVVGKQQLLTTIDQPFGLGLVDHEGLCTYRRDSEGHSFVVNKDHEEEDHSPVARVFIRRLPEWTFDLNSYTPRQFPQQACAIRCGLHGYLGLPVFDMTAGSCVGVVEILMSSQYTSYAYEVHQLHVALKTENLTSPQGFDFPTLYVPNENKQNDLDEILGILKRVCNVLNLPLAQTWAVSQHCSFVACKTVIKKSCSSFDSRCVGKVCMSTTALPFYVQDLSMWNFHEACKERHLDRSCGLVGKALSTSGSCFCGDVTELGEQEYPLVHNARMNKLISCFAILLHSVYANDDYVLEFFLPPYIKDSCLVRHLVQILKQNIEVASRFELGDTSFIQDVGSPTQTSSGVYSSDSPVTKMVTAKITFIDAMKIFNFSLSSGLSYLENEVAQSFELEGEIILKYKDEDDELILITNDDDLKLAVDTTAVNNRINLICQPRT